MWHRILIILLLLCIPTQAADVHFAWDANSEPDLTGYRLYRGTQSRVYTTSVTLGKVTDYTWTVPDGSFYYALTAFNPSGESGYSNEVFYATTVQPPAPATGVNVSWSEVTQPMATPPTLVNKYESAWNTSADKTVLNNVALQSGDLLIIAAATEGSSGSYTFIENGAGSATLEFDNIGNAPISVWSYIAPANENITTTVQRTGGYMGAVAWHFRSHGGLGTKNSAASTSGDPTVTLSSVAANSAIVMIVSDWNAVSGTQTANTTIGAFTPATGYPGDGAHYGVFAGYYPDAGAAGNKAIGMTVPDGQDWTIAGIEVKGTAGGGVSIPVLMNQYRQRR